MTGRRFVNLFIDPNPNCAEGCGQRFQTVSEPRPVRRIRYDAGAGEIVVCRVSGWSSAEGGVPCPAHAAQVEDSGAGVATLVYGGDWGIRLVPEGDGPPVGLPYLL